jgi:exodeoxyribonuclease-1
LIKSAQPRLFDFCLGLHRKDRVAQELGLPTTQAAAKPFWHVSGMFAPERGCLALMWPLAMHPTNRNELLAWDLRFDPRELADLRADHIRLRLFTKTQDLPEGVARLPLKSVHLNKSPMVFGNLKVVDAEQARRWDIDLDAQLHHAALARDLPDMSAIWAEVFASERGQSPLDADEDLYGGFVGNADRRRLNDLRLLEPDALATARPAFDDVRLSELFWRYRARNFPQTLTDVEQQAWQAHRAARLFDGEGGHCTLEAFFEDIDRLAESADDRDQAILSDLYDYAESIAPSR